MLTASASIAAGDKGATAPQRWQCAAQPGPALAAAGVPTVGLADPGVRG
jgi:hypothetical protein